MTMHRIHLKSILFLVFLMFFLGRISPLTAHAALSSEPGWHRSAGKYYYIREDGTQVKKSWLTVNGKTYYLNRNGYRVTGLFKVYKRYYYFHPVRGYMLTGWRELDGKYYRFHNPKGYRMSGWYKYGGYRYYLDPADNGARVTGWKVINGAKYYFNRNGRMLTGLIKIKDKVYYLASNGKMQTGWKKAGKNRYYFSRVDGAAFTGWRKVGKQMYYFDARGRLVKSGFSEDGIYLDEKGLPLQRSTLKKFLQTALQPVGSTMYVWGGGWNKEDTGAGEEAVTIGVSSKWKEFFEKQNSSYDYNTTRYQIHNGLDCSGFVGWAIYNAFYTSSGHTGYVYLAQNMTRIFSDMGWGSFTSAGSYSDYRAGDICSSSRHVYIVIGQCDDSSVVFVHSSPQGVQICGTPTRGGNSDSEAIRLARKYMQKYYPAWYAKYQRVGRDYSYLTDYSRMRWHLAGNCLMTDPDHYSSKNAEQILEDLFA